MSGAFEEGLRSVSLLSDSSIAGYTGPPGYVGSAVPNNGKIYRFVKITGKNTVGLATANSDLVIGVLQNKPQVTGQAATVGIRGISIVCSGAGTDAVAIVPGSPLTTDATGRAIVAEGTEKVYGYALQGVTVDDALISVLLKG